MPLYKALILNREINLNYEENQKEKLVEAVNTINSKLNEYENLNGKTSDTKLLSFLAIKLQAELLDYSINQKNKINLEEKIKNSNNINLDLADQIHNLRRENEFLKKENKIIDLEIKNLEKQIDIVINLVRNTYDE